MKLPQLTQVETKQGPVMQIGAAGNPGSLTLFQFTRLAAVLISIVILLPFNATECEANSFGINLYGISYHVLEDYQSRDNLNEFNPGLGLRASFGSASTNTLLLEGGVFKDTFENQAKYMGLGYLIRVVGQFRIGVLGAIYVTESFSDGGTLALVPLGSFSIGPVTLNGVYLPKFRDVNPYNTFGGYLTIRIFEGELKKKN